MPAEFSGTMCQWHLKSSAFHVLNTHNSTLYIILICWPWWIHLIPAFVKGIANQTHPQEQWCCSGIRLCLLHSLWYYKKSVIMFNSTFDCCTLHYSFFILIRALVYKNALKNIQHVRERKGKFKCRNVNMTRKMQSLRHKMKSMSQGIWILTLSTVSSDDYYIGYKMDFIVNSANHAYLLSSSHHLSFCLWRCTGKAHRDCNAIAQPAVRISKFGAQIHFDKVTSRL